jgi:hypothetical protein
LDERAPEPWHSCCRLEEKEEFISFWSIPHLSLVGERFFSSMFLPLLEKLWSHLSSQEILPPPLHGHRRFNTVYKSPPLAPILNQINPVHNLPPYFRKIHSNVMLPSLPRSSEWSLPFKYSYKKLVRVPITPMRSTWPSHLILPYLIRSSLCILPHHLFSNTLNLCSSLCVTDQVSQFHKTTESVTALHLRLLYFVLNFIFFFHMGTESIFSPPFWKHRFWQIFMKSGMASWLKSRSSGLWCSAALRPPPPPKYWYPTTALHGVAIQKTWTWIFITVKTSILVMVPWH